MAHDEGHHHGGEEEQNHGQHNDDQSIIVWRGVVILSVLAIFFVIERLLNIFGEWKQRLQSTKQVSFCS